MRITQYSDYALRTLIYLAVKPNPYELANIQDVADSYGISKNHLTKIVHQLNRIGLIDSTRGKNGGIRLAKAPKDINIGEVLRQTETDFAVVACFVPCDYHATQNQPITVNPERLKTDRIAVTQTLIAKDISELPEPSSCVISPACQLKSVFFEATQAFLQVFDRYTLADVLKNPNEINRLLK